jgi:hypothetical protein
MASPVLSKGEDNEVKMKDNKKRLSIFTLLIWLLLVV